MSESQEQVDTKIHWLGKPAYNFSFTRSHNRCQEFLRREDRKRRFTKALPVTSDDAGHAAGSRRLVLDGVLEVREPVPSARSNPRIRNDLAAM